MQPTLIALDAGTTGVSCVLFDLELRPLARAYRELPQHFPRPGWVEHEGGQILERVDAVLAEILALPEAADVRALGLTNQRETVFAIDPGGGQALLPGIVWQDRRTAERCAQLRAEGHEPLVRRKSGLLLDPYFSASKIEWLLHSEPDLAERAAGGGVLFCTVDALIVQHLTEQTLCATDPTNASRTALYDIDAKRWDEQLCKLFSIEPEWLPQVRPSAGDFGTTSKYLVGREIPIRGLAGDQQAAAFGQGCVDAGALKNTYGTGCFLLLHTGAKRVNSDKGLLTTLALAADGSPAYALEGSVFIAGALVQWLRDQLHFFPTSAQIEALAAEVQDSGGVHVVPAFTGLGAPHWDAQARGAILGLTRGSSRAHIARAALEAIAFQSAELLELLRQESGLELTSFVADGGAAANQLLLQLQADLAGVRVQRSSELYATARGAAALAGVGAGLLRDPRQCAALREVPQVFEPRTGTPARAERMAQWLAAVERVKSGQQRSP